ncbi:MAG: hypothetical protein AB9869_13015 [Verrucomicrobiia bacterium]
MEELREFIANDPSTAFCQTEEEMLDLVNLFVEAEEVELDERKFVKDFIRARRIEEATWGKTDCDRVDAAFAELRGNYLLAEQNFCCCQNCGIAALEKRAQEIRACGGRVRGYVFYHAQDTDAASETRNLWIAHGPLPYRLREAMRLGHRVVSTLQRHGLAVEWNEDPDTRILIKLKDWRKRLEVIAGVAGEHADSVEG